MTCSARKAFFQVEAETTIDAPVVRVWAVLADLERYGEWNRFVPSMEATLKVGATLRMGVQMRSRWRVISVEDVTVVEPGKRLAWRTRSPGWLLRGERFQTLEPLDSEQTRYYTVEAFSGLLAPLLKLMLEGDLRRGFAQVAHDLKMRAETPA